MRPEMKPLTDEDGEEFCELTAEDFKRMRPLSEIDPGLMRGGRRIPAQRWAARKPKPPRSISASDWPPTSSRASRPVAPATTPASNRRCEEAWLRDQTGEEGRRRRSAPRQRKNAPDAPDAPHGSARK